MPAENPESPDNTGLVKTTAAVAVVGRGLVLARPTSKVVAALAAEKQEGVGVAVTEQMRTTREGVIGTVPGVLSEMDADQVAGLALDAAGRRLNETGRAAPVVAALQSSIPVLNRMGRDAATVGGVLNPIAAAVQQAYERNGIAYVADHTASSDLRLRMFNADDVAKMAAAVLTALEAIRTLAKGKKSRYKLVADIRELFSAESMPQSIRTYFGAAERGEQLLALMLSNTAETEAGTSEFDTHLAPMLADIRAALDAETKEGGFSDEALRAETVRAAVADIGEALLQFRAETLDLAEESVEAVLGEEIEGDEAKELLENLRLSLATVRNNEDEARRYIGVTLTDGGGATMEFNPWLADEAEVQAFLARAKGTVKVTVHREKAMKQLLIDLPEGVDVIGVATLEGRGHFVRIIGQKGSNVKVAVGKQTDGKDALAKAKVWETRVLDPLAHHKSETAVTNFTHFIHPGFVMTKSVSAPPPAPVAIAGGDGGEK